MIPVLAFAVSRSSLFALNPSLLQLYCKEPWEPNSVFHMSAISECSESAASLMVIKFVASSPGIFIPRQIVEKDVLQYVGSLVSSVSNPVSPPHDIECVFVAPEIGIVMDSLLENKRKLALLEDHKIPSNIIYAKETMPEDECLYSSCNIRSSLMKRHPYS